MKKTYEVTLTPQAPIFIGSGEKLNKFEYLFQKATGKITMIDVQKLSKVLLGKNLLDAYTKEIIDGNPNLYQFVKKHQLNQTEFTQYSTEVHRKSPNDLPNEIQLFARDGQGFPYIPGSSLKGALRTAILQKHQDDKKDNEIFQRLQISDSQSLQLEDLAIYQKIDYGKNLKGLPTYRECLKKGVKITFTLSLDTNVLTIEDLKKHLKDHYRHIYEKWLFGVAKAPGVAFGKKEVSVLSLEEMGKKEIYPLYLGGGSGFVSKTLHYKEKSREQARRDIFSQFKSGGITRKVYGDLKNCPPNVPIALKLVKNGDVYEEIGKCFLVFKEI